MLSRRTFLKLFSALGVGALFGRYGTRFLFGNRSLHCWGSDLEGKISDVSKVAIVKETSYEADLGLLIKDGIEKLGYGNMVKNKWVVLKPNMVEYEADYSINTHPSVVGGAIDAFTNLGARKITVAEGPGHRRDTELLLKRSGLRDVLRKRGIEFVDLNVDAIKKIPMKSSFTGIKTMYFPETITDADLVVSIPKMKTHHWVGVTLSMKNMFGTVPGVKYGWPKNILHWHNINSSIIDINSTVSPGFAIVDGIVGMEGNGPLHGIAKKSGVLVMGSDLVAVDATCTRIMGLEPSRIEYLKLANRHLGNLESDRIEQIGEPIDAVRQDFALIKEFAHLRKGLV
jgi:uncharacterized protein (DUF362 family)